MPESAAVAAGPLAADQATTRPAIPQAQAFDKNNKPMASVEPVVRYCAGTPGGCNFKMAAAAQPQQFFSTVKSLGNAVINCTKNDITVDRTVQLQTGSQDNLGGEITGSAAVQGHINASGEVSAGVNGEGHATAKTPNLKDGPNAEVGAKGGVNAGGKVGAQVGLQASFSAAFKAHYAKTWTTTHTESTKYQMTVKRGDVLVFGASAAMERISGTLRTNTGQSVTNVIVDGPSTVNSSSFIARTNTAPGDTCDRLRPAGSTAADNNRSLSPKATDRSLPVPKAQGSAPGTGGGPSTPQLPDGLTPLPADLAGKARQPQ
ncbi:hypothetical protein [Streptomyces agglomeratus]|uniref:hypothetical protein n=1 Tax=Streptomyces agglomeratus TaxID=285458 RepID=UPI00114CBA95|nr:hypothetical protein [Streptomyces agglomeratus]